MRDVSVVPLRVLPGDDASCLNLNRAQTPQLLGVDPDALISRNSFTFVKTWDKGGWKTLKEDPNADIVPAIGDQATVVWGLGKTIGDHIDFTDEAGQPFRVRIVGIIANSILQGNLIISEHAFIEKYPSHSGYSRLLIDAPPLRVESLSDYLNDRMQDVGLNVTSAAQRLAQFGAVEHTYLAIFQALGGLSLLLGGAGLGLIVMRNVLERRSELALLQAVGFTRRTITRLLLIEHAGLLLMGLISGSVAGFVAVSPVFFSPGARMPLVSMAITLIVIIAIGVGTIMLTSRIALRGRLVAALAEE
jgi:ABC-type antimicrobial peptide transport system permease subunit